MIVVYYHPEFKNELHNALRHYASISKELALEFLEAEAHTRKRVISEPEMFNLREQGVRRANLQTPFHEWYQAYLLKENQLIFIALAHAKRSPYYFSGRAKEVEKK